MCLPDQPGPAVASLPELLQPALEEVDRILSSTASEVDEPLAGMLKSALDGGKRVRATVVILVGQLLTSPPQQSHRLAAAVEVLHAATLVHDDLIDQARVRRGRPALHAARSPAVSVLAGDYMLARAAAMFASLEDARILEVFGKALCVLCDGEIRQLLRERDGSASRSQYYRDAEAKTAALFAAAAEMAGLLAGANEGQLAVLRIFGQQLGLAFQIVDDVLDLTGSEAELGKPVGSDLRQGLVTLPVLCYLEDTPEEGVVRAVLDGQHDETHVLAAIQAIRSSRAIDAALMEARACASRSQEALSAFPDGAARRALNWLAESCTERKH